MLKQKHIDEAMKIISDLQSIKYIKKYIITSSINLIEFGDYRLPGLLCKLYDGQLLYDYIKVLCDFEFNVCSYDDYKSPLYILCQKNNIMENYNTIILLISYDERVLSMRKEIFNDLIIKCPFIIDYIIDNSKYMYIKQLLLFSLYNTYICNNNDEIKKFMDRLVEKGVRLTDQDTFELIIKNNYKLYYQYYEPNITPEDKILNMTISNIRFTEDVCEIIFSDNKFFITIM